MLHLINYEYAWLSRPTSLPKLRIKRMKTAEIKSMHWRTHELRKWYWTVFANHTALQQFINHQVPQQQDKIPKNLLQMKKKTHLWWTPCCRACPARRPWPASWAAAARWRSAATGRAGVRPCPAVPASASASPARPSSGSSRRRIPFCVIFFINSQNLKLYINIFILTDSKNVFWRFFLQFRSLSSKRSPKLWKKSAWTVLSLAVRSFRRTAGPPTEASGFNYENKNPTDSTFALVYPTS